MYGCSGCTVYQAAPPVVEFLVVYDYHTAQATVLLGILAKWTVSFLQYMDIWVKKQDRQKWLKNRQKNYINVWSCTDSPTPINKHSIGIVDQDLALLIMKDKERRIKEKEEGIEWSIVNNPDT